MCRSQVDHPPTMHPTVGVVCHMYMVLTLSPFPLFPPIQSYPPHSWERTLRRESTTSSKAQDREQERSPFAWSPAAAKQLRPSPAWGRSMQGNFQWKCRTARRPCLCLKRLMEWMCASLACMFRSTPQTALHPTQGNGCVWFCFIPHSHNRNRSKANRSQSYHTALGTVHTVIQTHKR